MKTISPALASHLAGEVTSLSTCWKVTRADAAVYGFTDADIDLNMGGVTYAASTGFTASDIATTAQLSVDNLDLLGALSSDAITLDDLNSAKWDGATIEIFKVNRDDLTQGALIQRVGTFGEVNAKDQSFSVEARGLTQALQQSVGRVVMPACDADFCDTRCSLNAVTYTVTGSVTTTLDGRRFYDAARTEPDNTFRYGRLTWTSGANLGTIIEVRGSAATSGLIDLLVAMRKTIAIGDTYSMLKGCAKTPTACKAYSNYVNFRGFPDLPGIDQILKVGGQ